MNTNNNLERLKAFYSLLDGSCRDFANVILPALMDLYHEDMRLFTAKDDCKTRDDMIAMIKSFNNAGGKADMEIFEEMPDGDILYAGHLTTPDGLDVKIRSLATFKDGKLFIIQPTDPEVCLIMMNHAYKEVVEELEECPGMAGC